MAKHVSATVTAAVILTGMPGGGKSATGRALAKILDIPLVETDAAVEEKAGMSVADIFAKHGEKEFRTMESAALKKFVNKRGARIIATGGGIVLSLKNRRLIAGHGGAVYLHASPEMLEKRLGKDDGARPLMQSDSQTPAEIIARLFAEREEFYRQTARLTVVQHADDTPVHVAQKIAAGLRNLPPSVFSGEH